VADHNLVGTWPDAYVLGRSPLVPLLVFLGASVTEMTLRGSS
jgi:hypothetical protein